MRTVAVASFFYLVGCAARKVLQALAKAISVVLQQYGRTLHSSSLTRSLPPTKKRR